MKAKPSTERSIYAFYPHGDKDPMSRNERQTLVYENGKWRYLGQENGPQWNEYKLGDIISALESGHAEVHRLDEHGLTVSNAREEFLGILHSQRDRFRGAFRPRKS